MSGSTRKVLVVDDEAHIVQVVSLKLRNAGYTVLTAEDGEEAYEVVCAEHPDLVITDFQMPYMTGLELCTAMFENPECADIPVFLLTARGHAIDEESLSRTNIQEVLSKPFSPRAILESVDNILNNGGDGENTRAEAA